MKYLNWLTVEVRRRAEWRWYHMGAEVGTRPGVGSRGCSEIPAPEFRLSLSDWDPIPGPTEGEMPVLELARLSDDKLGVSEPLTTELQPG